MSKGRITLLSVVALLAILTVPLLAQVRHYNPRAASYSFTAQTATGATSGIFTQVTNNHAIHLITTGGPTGCTYRLQGSIDNINWYDISAADVTCTSNVAAFEVNKPAPYVRGSLLTLTAGTSPTVTLHYAGR